MAYGFQRWFGYGLGAAVGQALFGGASERRKDRFGPVRNQTEEEIRADEERFREDERRLDAEDAKRAGK